KLSSSTLAIGATQLVVQDALDRTWCVAGSYASSLTPITIVRSSSLAGTVLSTVSYLSRCAIVAMSPRSLAATISMPRSPSEALAARQKLRPMRPNPLIPTRIVTVPNLLVDPRDRQLSETIGRRLKDGQDQAPDPRGGAAQAPGP